MTPIDGPRKLSTSPKTLLRKERLKGRTLRSRGHCHALRKKHKWTIWKPKGVLVRSSVDRWDGQESKRERGEKRSTNKKRRKKNKKIDLPTKKQVRLEALSPNQVNAGDEKGKKLVIHKWRRLEPPDSTYRLCELHIDCPLQKEDLPRRMDA